MIPPRPCFPKLVVLAVSLIIAGLSDTSHGQQLELSDDGRVETRADDRVEGVLEIERIDDSMGSGDKQQDDDLTSGGWDLGLAVSVAYDDNIFLSATNPESDLVIRITPRIAYVLGNVEADEGAYIRFDYRPTGVLYAENGDENRIDQDVTLLAGVGSGKTSVAFNGNYRQLGDAIADTGTQTDRQEYAAEIRAAYSVSEKVALEVAAGIYGTEYDAAGLSGTRDSFAEVAVRYAYSPKTQVTLGYRVGRAEVDGTGDQTFHRTTARLAWQPRQKISVDLEAGFEHRTFDNGSDNYPVAELRVGWEAREGTEFYVSGYRREEVSAFFTGQNYSLTGFTAGVSQRFSDAWVGRLEGGYEKASYYRVSGSGPAGRRDEIYFIRPTLVYEVNDRFSAGVYYQYSKNESNQGAFGYDNHQVGVSAEYDF